jgi:molecular chaperone DnaK (HSP70)
MKKNFREKNITALNKQVEALFALVDDTVKINGGGCYTNQMYKEAEAELKRVEEQKRLEAEAEKRAEVDRIKAECRVGMQQEIDNLEEEYKKRMSAMREEIRKDIAERDDGIFARIGKTLDAIIPLKNLFK